MQYREWKTKNVGNTIPVSTFLFAACFISFLLLLSSGVMAQQAAWKVRIAKIEIDSTYLVQYRAALEEHAKEAVRVEPGVLVLNAVYDKAHPSSVTVFEVYANDSAYQAHLKTPHFIKYKTSTKEMVKSLELVDVIPIAMESKLTNDKTKQ